MNENLNNNLSELNDRKSYLQLYLHT